MFTEEEQELITRINYQIFNNGIDSLYHNNYYRYMFDYVDLLKKQGSELALEVELLIKRAFIILIEIEKFTPYVELENLVADAENGNNYSTAAWLSELKEELKQIENKYCEISESFLKLLS